MHVKTRECSPKRLFISLNNRFDDCIKLVTLKNLPKACCKLVLSLNLPLFSKVAQAKDPRGMPGRGGPALLRSLICTCLFNACTRNVSAGSTSTPLHSAGYPNKGLVKIVYFFAFKRSG